MTDPYNITDTIYQDDSVTDAMIREEESLKADNARDTEEEKREVFLFCFSAFTHKLTK